MKRHKIEAIEGYLFVSPVIIGLLVFAIWPICQSLFYSFTEFSVIKSPVWKGLSNYQRLFSNPDFWNSFKLTAEYTIITVPLGLIAGFLLAVLLSSKIPGVNLFRTIYYLPVVVPVVALAIIWKQIYSPDFGLANMLLGLLGLPPYSWFSRPESVMISLILMGLWQCGASMIIWLAGLQSVPNDLHEAAIIDGAPRFKRFLYITIPMVTPVIFFNLIMGLISAFQVFGQVLVATNGGPLRASNFLMVEIYYRAFQTMEMGYASAIAWVLFVVIIILTIITFRTSREWVFYEGEVRR